jgi:hypothetical protein
MARPKSSKQLILDYFLANRGKILESRDIQAASGGAVEWARRVRELRNEEGYQILSHKDRADLKPNQYLLETTKRTPAFKRNISKETRRGCSNETAIHAKCAVLLPVIQIHWAAIVPFGSPWDISSINRREVKIHLKIFERFVRIVMKDYRIQAFLNRTKFTC